MHRGTIVKNNPLPMYQKQPDALPLLIFYLCFPICYKDLYIPKSPVSMQWLCTDTGDPDLLL